MKGIVAVMLCLYLIRKGLDKHTKACSNFDGKQKVIWKREE